MAANNNCVCVSLCVHLQPDLCRQEDTITTVISQILGQPSIAGCTTGLAMFPSVEKKRMASTLCIWLN